MKPTEIIVNDDASIRSDLKSNCVKTTYVNLPVEETWRDHKEYVKLRNEYVRKLDMKAYESIKDKFPNFTPPKN